MMAFKEKLQSIHEATGKKVCLVTHSMGGLLFKSFLALHHSEVAAHVDKWIAIAAPFRGMNSVLTYHHLTQIGSCRTCFASSAVGSA